MGTSLAPSRPVQQTGSSCASTAACYPGIDAAALKGTATCLTQLQGGYCTHTCTSNSDCCAIPGECPAGFAEVCAPLESNPTFTCRSTGGGSANQKFCGP